MRTDDAPGAFIAVPTHPQPPGLYRAVRQVRDDGLERARFAAQRSPEDVDTVRWLRSPELPVRS